MDTEPQPRGEDDRSNPNQDQSPTGRTSGGEDEVERSSTESLVTTNSSLSSVTSDEEENKTVIEKEEPDYKGMYEEYRQRLDEKTEHLRTELNKLGGDLKEKHEENSKLRESNRALARTKEEEGKILAEKESEIKDLKSRLDGKVDISHLILNRRVEETFKMRPRKRNGSTTTLEVNKCDNENCGAEDTDLVKCSICSKFVCETCNEVPVGKLKPVVKTCNRIYFICKLCHTKCDDADVESYMAKLKIDDVIEIAIDDRGDRSRKSEDERNDLQKIITTMEETQKSLSETIADKEELISNQRKVIDELKTKADMSTSPEDLKEVRDIVAIKEAEVSSCQNEIQRLKKVVAELENHDVKQAEIASQLQAEKDKNEALQRRLDDQITITSKTEMALKTQEKLTAAKVDLIENLKTKIFQGKTPSCSEQTDEGQNLTSNINRTSVSQIQDGDGETVPGIEECLVCIKSISLHGVILD